MKKFRTAGIITLLSAIIITISCKTHFETTHNNYTAVSSRETLERGHVLVYSICAGCHYNRGVNKFIGNRIEDVPGIAGKVYSANLTHSKTYGVTDHYSNAELKYLLKTGVAKDGRFLSYMLRPNMADADINDIIVFLRSDDPGLAATDTSVGKTHFTLVGKMYMSASAKPLPYNDGIKRPSAEEPVALGRYLVDNLACFHCHSHSLTSLNLQNPEQSKGYLAGGFKMKGANGTQVVVANITPDKNTGIGNFSREQFIKAVKDGEAPGHHLKPPMPEFKLLSDAEIGAIYAYIQTVPPVYNRVK